MRWQSQQGIISPAGFINIAEELGLIIPMTEAALERGLIDLKKWHNGHPTLYLSEIYQRSILLKLIWSHTLLNC